MAKFVYNFGEGDIYDKHVLGGKGCSLGQMINIGLPVPPGFTITCQASVEYMNTNQWPAELAEQMQEGVAATEKALEKTFGDNNSPLLFSVRSGAAISMPGMMDTVLNLGLNDVSVLGFAKSTNNERLAYDAYRRFCQMFGDVVMGVPHHEFEEILDAMKAEVGAKDDTELSVENLKELVTRYRTMIKRVAGRDFPQDPNEQLKLAVNAVFDSWNNPRAVTYRNMYKIPHDIGTAVNVQAMVFGNAGEASGTGVGFTRDPATGHKEMYGEFLVNAQGEDVVAGIRTPLAIDDMLKLGPEWAKCHAQLVNVYETLEKHYGDMVDLEFTIENHKLFMLQARVGKRTATAMIDIAHDMVEEGLITKEQAIMRVDTDKINELLFKQFDPEAEFKSIDTGLAASPGAAVGQIVFTARAAEQAQEEGKEVILVRRETSPEDLAGMVAANGILTARGGRTSHAAVVARGMGKCCVSACPSLVIDEEAETCKIGGQTFKAGDFISLDGTTGGIAAGAVATVDPELSGKFEKVMSWCEEFATVKVRTNADTPHDAGVARKFGATGIGLCRTEHMFFEPERIVHMREMILAQDQEARKVALDKLLPYQEEDFHGLFMAMDGCPVIIRLLDPPLHEFIPHDAEGQAEVAAAIGNITAEEIAHRVHGLMEANPMLGFRGVRLGMIYPEISVMQVKAIMQAAVRAKADGATVIPEIMIPLVCTDAEMAALRALAVETADKVIADAGVEMEYMVGTMIELPRACVVADKIAKHAEFFSFGTNDLHQTTFGISRDDGAKFIPTYVEKKAFASDPFVSIDQDGVGELMKMAVQKGRATREGMEIGVCGEHGGEPASIRFCHKIGLTYVSCSPYRVLTARVAAAQAAIEQK